MQAKGVISDDATYFGCDGFDGIESAFTEANPISAIPQEISYLSHFDASAESGTAKEFIDSYTAKYGKDTLNQFGRPLTTACTRFMRRWRPRFPAERKSL